MNKMINQAMIALVCALCVQVTFAQQKGPEAHDEIHSIDYKPMEGRDVRGEMFGMTADEKAGLTVGFVVMGFFLFLSVGFMGQMNGKISTLEAKVEALVAQADADAAIAKL